MVKKRKKGIPRMLELANAKKGLLALAGALSVASTLLMFVPFVSAYFIVAELLRNAPDPTLSDSGLILRWAFIALAALAAALVSLYTSAIASHFAAFRILYNLRIRLAEHLGALPMGFHTRESTGSIKKILEVNVERIENFIAHHLPDFIGAAALPLIMLTVMFLLDWRLALSCAVPVIAAFALQAVVFQGEKAKEHTRLYHDALENMNAAGVEYVRGMPAVKVFGLTVRTFLGFHDAIQAYRKQATQISKTYKHPYTLFFIILSSIPAFVLPVGLHLFSEQTDNQAFALTLLLFLVMSPGLPIPILKLLNLGGNMRMIAEGVERIDELFARSPLPEPQNPEEPKNYSVTFEDVRFSYATEGEADAPEALSGVSFHVAPGTLTALVGPSGSGKSTIASLIPRFWDVGSGTVSIGGVDIRRMRMEQLMNSISFVFQDVHLFYDSIEENIRMGNSSASREQVIAAARAACCHDFISSLPDGYATKIGEGGTYLSGGEAQRISIARAVLKNAPILVLDEATAFADPDNETRIQQALNTLIRGKTVIIIAHRLSTIRNADQIIVMDKGKIAEHGRHEDLLEKNGVYRRMWQAHTEAVSWRLGHFNFEKV